MKKLRALLVTLLIGIGVYCCFWLLVYAPEFSDNLNGNKNVYGAQTYQNMVLCAKAASAYRFAHNGRVPLTSADKVFHTYFPGGIPDSKPGSLLLNPVTRHREWPFDLNMRLYEKGDITTLPNGAVAYSVIFNKKGQPTDYEIRGVDVQGHLLQGLRGTIQCFSSASGEHKKLGDR